MARSPQAGLILPSVSLAVPGSGVGFQVARGVGQDGAEAVQCVVQPLGCDGDGAGGARRRYVARQRRVGLFVWYVLAVPVGQRRHRVGQDVTHLPVVDRAPEHAGEGTQEGEEQEQREAAGPAPMP